jgi:hypothetical protein
MSVRWMRLTATYCGPPHADFVITLHIHTPACALMLPAHTRTSRFLHQLSVVSSSSLLLQRRNLPCENLESHRTCTHLLDCIRILTQLIHKHLDFCDQLSVCRQQQQPLLRPRVQRDAVNARA